MNTVSISLNKEETEYLRSLVKADSENSETNKIATIVYEQLVAGRLTVIVDMNGMM